MSHRTWVIADTHFGHANSLNFLREDGSPLRDFESVEEMDEHMIDNWNRVVSEKDRVYLLGDAVMKRKNLPTLGRLKGRLVLVRGNHDIFKLKDYLPYFDDIRAVVVQPKNGIIFSHYPLHPSSLSKLALNVHGHIHDRKVMLDENTEDYRYYCISVEQINYTPVNMEDLIELAKLRRGVLV